VADCAGSVGEVLHSVLMTTRDPLGQDTLIACPQCGARTPDIDGPTHPYMVSSPGCWRAFAELQADELTRFGYPPAHGRAVDAYSATHGGDGSQRRDRQSVCLHLMAICLLLEADPGPDARIRFLRERTATKVDWPTLRRPPGIPSLNLQHAAAAVGVEDYSTRVDQWAHAVWDFWTPEHSHVQALLGAALPGGEPNSP
jgi:hypothetical protein